MDLSRILILAKESENILELRTGLILSGYDCDIVDSENKLASREPAGILLVETGESPVSTGLLDFLQRFKEEQCIIIVLLTDKKVLHDLGNNTIIDDFILRPYNLNELSVRIKRLQRKNKSREESPDYLVAGDITIDLPRCEVKVAGKMVDLTFTEYELLKLLIRQKGHVLTREVLLNEIWGYDYFGGDRTVDVHITRLRNKIEDTTHTFIETVRNIGYRIKVNKEG